MIHFFRKIQGVSLSGHFCKLLFPTSTGLSFCCARASWPPCALLSEAARPGLDSWIDLLFRRIQEVRNEHLLRGCLCWACTCVILCNFCYLPHEEWVHRHLHLIKEDTSGCRPTKLGSGRAWLWSSDSPKCSTLKNGRGPGCWHFYTPWSIRFKKRMGFHFFCWNQGQLKSLFSSFIDFFPSWFPCLCQIGVRLSVNENYQFSQ